MDRGKTFAIAAPIVWAAIVFLLHVIQIPVKNESSFRIPHADKFIHCCLFAGLSFLIARSFKLLMSTIFTGRLTLIFLICISYGGLLEIIQEMSWAARDSDIYDWFADITGTVLGLFFAGTKLLPFFFKHDVGKSA